MFQVPEKYRVSTERLPSTKADGNNGLFIMGPLRFIVSDGIGWEHVSVSRQNKVPTWNDMVVAKNLFWGDEDTVIQYHPPKSQYVNICEFCLHLWRPVGVSIPLPPKFMVG